jgi:predicted DCC family thiol-disulfide oxidoreductase YuxK
VLEALYCKQMSEQLFHNDETRWEVFVEIEGKVRANARKHSDLQRENMATRHLQ